MHRLVPVPRPGSVSANLPDPSPSKATPDAPTLLPAALPLSDVSSGSDTSEFIEILHR